jgi:hypothetical protein
MKDLMNVPARLAVFAAALAVIGGAATLAGAAIDPGRTGGADQAAKKDQHAMTSSAPASESQEVPGLAVAAGGLRLVLDTPDFEPGIAAALRFRIVDAHGDPVHDFDVEHTKRMHLIVVRRDMTGFQHLHPELAADGTWSVDLKLIDPGSYRVFADFSHEGEKQTLASDLRVDGAAELRPLAGPSNVARVDGYEVHRDGLDFTITRDGRAVTPDPYLGARGHLVALREGDLAYLHVHPEEDAVAFSADFPTPGRYRLFLQFQDGGRVHTAEFTNEVAQ